VMTRPIRNPLSAKLLKQQDVNWHASALKTERVNHRDRP
jgi:hypothetical protein